MAAPENPTGLLPSGQPASSPQEEGQLDPFALRFAWLIVAIAAAVSIGLVVVQLGWDWPFDPSRTTTTTQALDPDGKVIELTTSEADGGGAREALFRTVAGIAALTAGLLAWGRLEQSRRQHDLDRKAAARAVETQHLATRAQEATERGQVTARFTTAVEQLGHIDPSVRLGALYALEALARDSAGDRVTISEVVCAYARHHSIRRLPDGTPVLIQGDDGRSMVERVDGLAVDYQAAITIALRLPAEWNLPVRNLRGTVLADLNAASLGLSDGRLGVIDFAGATFNGYASFNGVTFTGNASFDSVTFTGDASFDRATFTGDATFDRATFAGYATSFGRATFTGDARFYEATFASHSWFFDATFTRKTWFGEATFMGDAGFDGATFTGEEASFERATFTGYTSFDGATFTGEVASFDGATFSDHTSFDGAIVERGLRLPEGVDPGRGFRQSPDDPLIWRSYEGEAAPRATPGSLA